jgi:subtilisin family serine protease
VPARFQDVITVSNIVDSDGMCGGKGSLTHRGPDDTLASNSNYGHVVDVAAPGVNILSTYLNNTYARLSGTSMSAPHVAGEAAYFMSLNPLASPSDVRNEIIASGSGPTTACDGNGFGYFMTDRDTYSEPVINIRNITTITAIPSIP